MNFTANSLLGDFLWKNHVTNPTNAPFQSSRTNMIVIAKVSVIFSDESAKTIKPATMNARLVKPDKMV